MIYAMCNNTGDKWVFRRSATIADESVTCYIASSDPSQCYFDPQLSGISGTCIFIWYSTNA